MRPRKMIFVLALVLLGASAAHAQLSFPPRRTVATLGACVDGKPRQAFVTNGTGAEDCSAGGGSTEVLCCCANGAWAACGTGAGGASFTSFDTDYGAETVTSAWDLSGATIELPNGTSLTSGDCDAAGEAGRVFIDTDATTGLQFYVCEGAAGWKLQGDGTGGITLRGIASATGPVNSTTASTSVDVVELNGLSLVDSLIGGGKTLKLDTVTASSSVFGSIQLQGDLSGSASSPQVANDSHTHGTSTIGGLDSSDITTGTLATARGGTNLNTSASTGVLRVSAGTWSANAGLSHLASSTSADLQGVLSDETGTGGGAVFATAPTISTLTVSDYVRLAPSASPPVACSAGTEGAIYYDSTDHDLCKCAGGTPAWASLGAGSCS